MLRRRQRVDVPTQPVYEAPVQLDRADFPEPRAPWLVAVFSSATCDACADVVRKAEVLSSADVDVVDVEYGEHRDLHAKYRIDGVPIVTVADARGVVRKSLHRPRHRHRPLGRRRRSPADLTPDPTVRPSCASSREACRRIAS